MKPITPPRFEVELRSTGHDPGTLEKALHRICGLAASPADIVNACPCIIATNISGNAAKKLTYYLEQVGAELVIRRYRHHAVLPQHPSPAKTASFTPERSSETACGSRPHKGTPGTALATKTVIMEVEAVPQYSRKNADAREGNSLSSQPAKILAAPEKDAITTTSITLKRSVGELTRSLQDKDWAIREAAIIELSAAPSNGIIRHIATMLKDDVWRVRCTALDALGKIGSRAALREMAKCLEDDVWHVRYQAVEALRRMESDRAIKPLLTVLHDENWQIRLKAVQALGEFRSKRSVAGLTTCLHDEVWQVREYAAKSLAQLHSEKAVKALAQSLRDPNWRVRSMAVTALWHIGSEKAIHGLIEAIQDPNWMVHWKAAYALGRIGTIDILSILSRLEESDHASLQESARRLLGTFELIADPHLHAAPRLEYRSEDQYAAMQYIPPGEFIMGTDDGPGDASPAQTIFLGGYFIDSYEVTNYQYKLFDPSHQYHPEMELYPVVNITWDQAQNYAAWLGKRLPSEAEWEKAARGPDGRIYPWGNEFDHTRCNTEESGRRRLAPVDLYDTGKSVFGVHDMIGNVLEWTGDRYAPYPWSQYECPDFKEHFIVLRGGSWLHTEQKLLCSTRFYAPAQNKSNFIGFRCVKDLNEKGGDKL